MNINWNSNFIDLQNLIDISRGDKNRTLKYLIQFQELIPERIENLKESLQEKDRKKTRQIVHKMSPQLKFFGIPDIEVLILRLELEYTTMPLEDLNSLVNDMLIKLESAVKEVDLILESNFT